MLGEKENYCAELLYQLEHYYHLDLRYFHALKAEISQREQWEEIVNRIIASNRNEHFVCEILNKEKRYQEIMNIIEKNDNVIDFVQGVQRLRDNGHKYIPYERPNPLDDIRNSLSEFTVDDVLNTFYF